MKHHQKWLEGEGWSNQMSVKVILTGLGAVLGGLCALVLFGVL